MSVNPLESFSNLARFEAKAQLKWHIPPGWSAFDWLWSGFSTRQGGKSVVFLPDEEIPAGLPAPSRSGELNLGFTAHDRSEIVLENRLRFAESVTGSRATPMVTVRQVHSNCSVTVQGAAGLESPIPEADGLITSQPGLLLAIQTADCIPVLVADVESRVVAAFHAGWRGTVERIVEMGVKRMQSEFGCRPESLRAAIGPGIGACCYAVGSEVHDRFNQNFDYAAALFKHRHERDSAEPALHLDLREANRRQLLDAGLAENAVSLVGGCTSCHPELYFSHRASGGRTGRLMAVIGIRPGVV